MAALVRYRGRVEFIALTIGHAGTTLIMTLDQLTAAFYSVRLTVERSRASRGAATPTHRTRKTRAPESTVIT